MASLALVIVAATVAFHLVVAQASVRAPGGIIYQWATFNNTLFLHMSAPTSWQWVAMGTGNRMRNSNMYKMYQNGKGGITLSTRTSNGHAGTYYEERENVDLLFGSGIVNQRMVANIRCRDGCDGQDMGGSERWIAGWRAGEALDSEDVNTETEMHTDARVYEVDLDVAALTSSAAFVDGSPFSGAVNPGTVGVTSINDPKPTVHGILMIAAFLVLYPLGAIIMPLFGLVLLHAIWQLVTFTVMWAGVATGIIVAQDNRLVRKPVPFSDISRSSFILYANPELFNYSTSLKSIPASAPSSAPSSSCNPSLVGCTIATSRNIALVGGSVRCTSGTVVSF